MARLMVPGCHPAHWMTAIAAAMVPGRLPAGPVHYSGGNQQHARGGRGQALGRRAERGHGEHQQAQQCGRCLHGGPAETGARRSAASAESSSSSLAQVTTGTPRRSRLLRSAARSSRHTLTASADIWERGGTGGS